jgi:hypothetical protein
VIDATTLKLRYPALAAVDDTVIDYWLTDAARIVTAAWGEDQEPATLALAAHTMSVTPGVLSSGSSSIPAGVTRFRSGSVDVSFSDTAAAQSATGGYAATIYGKEFAIMLRRFAGGPRLVGYVC